MRRARVGLAVALLAAGPAFGQTVSGVAFEDRDGDGVRDAGEPGLAGLDVRLFGRTDAGDSVDAAAATAPDGSFSFSPGDGCYVLRLVDPPGWRASIARDDSLPEGAPGYTYPVGLPRYGKMDQGIANLQSGTFRFTAMGDSIAYNWNSCFFPESFWYSRQIRSRLACTAPAASVTLDEAAVKGQHTDDLLVDDHDDLNNVFRVIEIQPELVTISMLGNDLLGVEPDADPSQEEINRAVAEMLDSRQNLQEAISALLTEIPGADVALNTVYDNRAWDCYNTPTRDFNRTWLPIAMRILRDLAWGQPRRVSVIEIWPEFSHEDQAGNCTGFDRMICRDLFQTDNIHPNNSGYTVVREKAWQAVGGVNLGSRDALGRTSIGDADYGFLRRVRRLLPSTWETQNGATVSDPEAALDDADGGAPARIGLGTGSEEFRVSRFPDWFDEIQIVRVLAGVRYRTTGTVTDDFYRFEASVAGQFRPPPEHAYTPTDWNYYTPIVGGGGPNQPPENPDFPAAEVLVVPEVASYREVTATLTKNPTLPQGAPDYEWPPVTHEELATTAIRVVASPVAGTPEDDAWRIELDAAWLDLYGWEKPRPSEVQAVRVDKGTGGALEVSFDALAGAQRYNLYWGRLATLPGGGYDHGPTAPAGPDCAATTQDAGGGRLEVVVPPAEQPSEDAYLLVTAHVDEVESPAGTRSDGSEIDRSQSTCR